MRSAAYAYMPYFLSKNFVSKTALTYWALRIFVAGHTLTPINPTSRPDHQRASKFSASGSENVPPKIRARMADMLSPFSCVSWGAGASTSRMAQNVGHDSKNRWVTPGWRKRRSSKSWTEKRMRSSCAQPFKHKLRMLGRRSSCPRHMKLFRIARESQA
ncbi:hypothetical protein BOTBODRAFT_30351 [Botryobasidium botryosum FD-172 SS1]|uniref:Uncharacterized protein n=1 Tax=Botryobasidium botryosum (strain FD-172 SS1) TaxID=930990 RepID=A0A067MYJ5_BOTB1|nr:hypothetical protein BOTBODRAFT_30351 [Botryobasidium botryosum FD-172 SS1]